MANNKNPVTMDEFRIFNFLVKELAERYKVTEDDEVRHRVALLHEAIERHIAETEEYKKTGKSLKRNFIPEFLNNYSELYKKYIPSGYTRKLNPVEQKRINELGETLREIHCDVGSYLKWVFEVHLEKPEVKKWATPPPNITLVCSGNFVDSFKYDCKDQLKELEIKSQNDLRKRDLYERTKKLYEATNHKKYVELDAKGRKDEISLDEWEKVLRKDEEIIFG